MFYTKATFNIGFFNYQIIGVRSFGSSNICRGCDSTDGQKLDKTVSIVSCHTDEESINAYYEKKYDSIEKNRNDTKMLDQLCDQKDKVIYLSENLNRSDVKAWLKDVPDNLGDPNISDNSDTSQDSASFPQDSSDLTQTDFSPFDLFED